MKYNVLGNIISVSINEEFDILAMIGRSAETNRHLVTMYIKDVNTGILDLIEEYESHPIECEQKQSFYETTKLIERLNRNHFFDYYMSRYDFLLDCASSGAKLRE